MTATPLRRRLLRSNSILAQAPGGINAFQDGIHLDFQNNYHYTKAPGAAPNVSPLTSLFTFTRNGPATFLGRSGLIEYANENLWLQSQTFDDVAWAKARVTVTANSITAPDGTLTADTISEDGTAANTHFIQQSIATIGIVQTLSVCLKAGTRSWAALQLGAGNTTYFNLGTGQLGIDGGVLARGMEPLGSGWYRCWITKLVNTNTNALIYIVEADGDAVFDGLSAASMYAWGGQLQRGFNVGPYLPTTTTAKYDQPRIEYDANGSCLGLLMEASRTNLCLQSQDLTTTWTTSSASVTANAASAPDGTLTADKIVDLAATARHYVAQSITKAASSIQYAVSAWFKAAERTFGSIRVSDGPQTGDARVTINLSNGVLSSTSVSGVGFSGATAVVSAYANGWFRVTLVLTSSTDTTLRVEFGPDVDSDPAALSYLGDGVSGLHVWGAQVEAAAFASSYIPTTTVSVARTADSCIRTLGSEFNATAGTAVVMGRAAPGTDATAQFFYNFDDGSTTERIGVSRLAGGTTLSARIFDGGAAQLASADTVANSATFKSAVAYAAADLASAVNGAAVQSSAGALPTVTTLAIGTQVTTTAPANGHILRFDYFPERKSNGYLQQWSRL